jgi:hypothetical protein
MSCEADLLTPFAKTMKGELPRADPRYALKERLRWLEKAKHEQHCQHDKPRIAALLKSLPPVGNKVPGPFGPGEKPTSFVMKIVPPDATTTGGSAPK